jgi:hypothetical protein
MNNNRYTQLEKDGRFCKKTDAQIEKKCGRCYTKQEHRWRKYCLEVPICDVRDTKLILASRDEKKKTEKTVEDTFCPFIFIDVRLQAKKYISFFLSFTFKGKKLLLRKRFL